MREQFVDPGVSRAKFHREISEYRQLEGEYRCRGWILARAEFPAVLVILAAPQLQPPGLVTGVAFDYTNYDAQPPSVRLVNPFTSEPYVAKALPIMLARVRPGTGPNVSPMPGAPGVAMQVLQIENLLQWHSLDEVPFLCIPGVREYHEHPAHTGDLWELHRATGAGRFVRLLEIIYRYGVAPITEYNVTLRPDIRFHVPQVPPQ